VVHQDAAHQLRAQGEEVRSILPVRVLDFDQPQPGFMDQGGGGQGLLLAFAGQVTAGQVAQLLIDERSKLGQRRLIPVAPPLEQPGDVKRRFRPHCPLLK
jgi:hypothetical protein